MEYLHLLLLLAGVFQVWKWISYWVRELDEWQERKWNGVQVSEGKRIELMSGGRRR